jgi:hypothetical protein
MNNIQEPEENKQTKELEENNQVKIYIEYFFSC